MYAHPGQSQYGSVPFFRQTPRGMPRLPDLLSEKEAKDMPVIFLILDTLKRLLRLRAV